MEKKTKLNKYTVVGICGCSCEALFVEHIFAENPIRAARKAERQYNAPDTAVFEGFLKDLTTGGIS